MSRPINYSRASDHRLLQRSSPNHFASVHPHCKLVENKYAKARCSVCLELMEMFEVIHFEPQKTEGKTHHSRCSL